MTFAACTHGRTNDSKTSKKFTSYHTVRHHPNLPVQRALPATAASAASCALWAGTAPGAPQGQTRGLNACPVPSDSRRSQSAIARAHALVGAFFTRAMRVAWVYSLQHGRWKHCCALGPARLPKVCLSFAALALLGLTVSPRQQQPRTPCQFGVAAFVAVLLMVRGDSCAQSLRMHSLTTPDPPTANYPQRARLATAGAAASRARLACTALAANPSKT